MKRQLLSFEWRHSIDILYANKGRKQMLVLSFENRFGSNLEKGPFKVQINPSLLSSPNKAERSPTCCAPSSTQPQQVQQQKLSHSCQSHGSGSPLALLTPLGLAGWFWVCQQTSVWSEPSACSSLTGILLLRRGDQSSLELSLPLSFCLSLLPLSSSLCGIHSINADVKLVSWENMTGISSVFGKWWLMRFVEKA